ncbi:DUF2314 domain-containing protein [Rhodopseudomonas sp. P2A-2r]|uniref:DUF2314 domain-containing protein n=1 Tax=Rhodopseudomonas sp. P2A-2r TaxID=2991972 RepID=UPI002234D646|nr:DUF2314 domain-containing protein [Rhodopseudomonas sp. P2A-2r]UZE48569.1 DUF2314 domain-containing protein [Rhodopseudomonas sp. P2A-2r]
MSFRLLAVAIVACATSQASAQMPAGKALRDGVISVRSNDAAMAAAMARADRELDAFLGIAAAPPAGAQHFSVKVRLPVGKESNEYIWIHPFTHDSGKFVGKVANTPRNFTYLALGDRLAFERKDVVDWSYRKGDRTIGNYTACALVHREPPQQRDAFMKQYGLDCPD